MKFKAELACAAVRPVKPSELFRVSGLLPAPNVPVGVMLGSLKPFDSVRRHSKPPLNACLRTDQLRSSPIEYRGLMPSRHRPNWPFVAKGRMAVAKVIVPIGTPFE